MLDTAVRALNALLMIALPLGVGVFLHRRWGMAWRIFGIGAVTFVASQVLHIPFNLFVLNPVIEKMGWSMDAAAQLAVIAVLAGLSAGVFEEMARYLFYRFWLKKEGDHTWRSGVMFGAGHGGIEALILGGIALAAFVQLLALRDADLSAQFPPEQLELARTQVETYWSLPWYASLLGAVERAAAICIHIGAAVLVLQVFRRKEIRWLFLAIGWHALVDALAVFGLQTWGMYVTEALVVGLGAGSLAIAWLLRDPEPAPGLDERFEQDAAAAIEPAAVASIEMGKPTNENLEDSRYD